MGNTNIQEDGTLAKQLFLAIRAHQMHVTPEKVVKEAEKFIESLPPLEKSSKTIHSRSSVCANSYQPRRSHPKPAHQVMKRTLNIFQKIGSIWTTFQRDSTQPDFAAQQCTPDIPVRQERIPCMAA